jgi:hypothetical protein
MLFSDICFPHFRSWWKGNKGSCNRSIDDDHKPSNRNDQKQSSNSAVKQNSRFFIKVAFGYRLGRLGKPTPAALAMNWNPLVCLCYRTSSGASLFPAMKEPNQ